MKKYYKIPLLFFFLAAGLGLFLRWQFIDPTPGIHYRWFLHSHSHVMFLGWVLNALYLSFIEYHLPEKSHAAYLRFFLFLQVLVLAMMISFPLQGYGMYSIIFSTLHTLAVMVFIVVFFLKTGSQSSISLWFGRVAWIFFTLSTAGPFSLGYLMANGMGNTIWYDLSIYYYLHFQYNGFFLFGVISLFYQLLERRQVEFNSTQAKRFGVWMAIACVPAYALSALFPRPGLFFNILGAGAAIAQIYAFSIFVRQMILLRSSIRLHFRRFTRHIFVVILIAWIFKLLLQLASAHPVVAELAYTLRPVVIAYLHMVLLGIITFFILMWYIERGIVDLSLSKVSMALMLAGFIGSEVCLVILPWWSHFMRASISSASVIFASSTLLFLGSGLIFAAAFFSPKGGIATSRKY